MAPPGELRVKAGVVLLAGKTVWSTPERLDVQCALHYIVVFRVYLCVCSSTSCINVCEFVICYVFPEFFSSLYIFSIACSVRCIFFATINWAVKVLTFWLWTEYFCMSSCSWTVFDFLDSICMYMTRVRSWRFMPWSASWVGTWQDLFVNYHYVVLFCLADQRNNMTWFSLASVVLVGLMFYSSGSYHYLAQLWCVKFS